MFGAIKERAFIQVIQIILLSLLLSGILSAEEMIFGSMGAKTYNQAQIDTMKTELGFNFFAPHSRDCADTDPYAKAGIAAAIQADGRPDDWVQILTYYNYALIQAENRGRQMDLYNRGGTNDTAGGYWVSDHQADTLYGPNNALPGDKTSNLYQVLWEGSYLNKYLYAGSDSLIRYNIQIKAKIDSRGKPDDLVLRLGMAYTTWGSTPEMIYQLDSLYAKDFPSDGSDGIFTFRGITLPVSTSVINSKKQRVTISRHYYGTAVVITSAGSRELSIDWLKIYDDGGIKLVEQHAFDKNIAEACRRFEACKEHLWGFYTRDEPYPLQFLPAGYMLDAIREYGDTNWNIYSANIQNQAIDYWFEVCHNCIIALDYYPFIYTGKNDSTNYAGYLQTGDVNSSVQASLNNCGRWFDTYQRSALAAGGDFWVMPQAFGGADWGGRWRRPTRAEFRCLTWMGLTYGAKALVFWKYDSWGNDSIGLSGLLMGDGSHSDLWYSVRDDINPYIKAIDSTYLTLHWMKADYVSPTHNPAIDLISSVMAYPLSIESASPDTGWFHVGVYRDSSDDYYFMLVNRACSQGPEDPSPAGPVAASIELKRDIVGSDYASVIDLAHSVRRNDAGEWTAVPDTVRTGADSLGLIPYVTVLRAGEGRLYKVVPKW